MPKQYSSRQYSSRSLTSITAWRKFATHRAVYALLAIVFAFGIVMYFGTGPGTNGRGQTRANDTSQSIATVNGVEIPRSQYDQTTKRLHTQMAGAGQLMMVAQQGQLLNQLIQQAVAVSLAKQHGLQVSDAEVDKGVENIRKSLGSGKAMTDEQFQEFLDEQGLTMDQARDQIREGLLAQAYEKSLVAKQANLSEEDLRKSYNEAKLRHILIASNSSPQAPPGALPDAQARTKAEKLLAEIKAGKDFATLASQNTDDPGSKAKGGEYDWAPLDNYVKPFADAAAALKPGEVSGVVKTDYGYHIIKLEGMREKLPKDYEKNKTQLMDNLRKSRAQKELAADMAAATKSAKIVWNDPSAKWRYDFAQAAGPYMMMLSQPGKAEPIIAELRSYVKAHTEDGEAYLVLATLLDQQTMMAAGPARDAMRKEEIAAYEAALKRLEDTDARFKLVDLYKETGQTDKATAELTRLQKLHSADTDTDPQALSLHTRLAAGLKSVGQADLAAQEEQTVAKIKAEQDRQAKLDAEARKQAAAKEAADKKKGATTLAPGAATTVTPGGTPAADTTKPNATAPKAGQ